MADPTIITPEVKPLPENFDEADMSLSDLYRSGKLNDKEIKARFASLLERGVVNDRLHVDLPPDVHGEWVPNNAQDISRAKAMGFEVDMTYAVKRAIHSDGTGRPIVGDVIHMITPKRFAELREEVRMERYNRLHSPKKGKVLIDDAIGTDLPTVNESRTGIVSGQQIANTLNAT